MFVNVRPLKWMRSSVSNECGLPVDRKNRRERLSVLDPDIDQFGTVFDQPTSLTGVATNDFTAATIFVREGVLNADRDDVTTMSFGRRRNLDLHRKGDAINRGAGSVPNRFVSVGHRNRRGKVAHVRGADYRGIHRA